MSLAMWLRSHQSTTKTLAQTALLGGLFYLPLDEW